MLERKINKNRLILIIILLCAAGFYAVKFVLPMFETKEKIEGENVCNGEFYTANVSGFRKNFEGKNGTLRINGSELSIITGGAYSKNLKEALIYTNSEKGVSYALDYGNESFKTRGDYSGNLDAVSIMFTLTSATGKGFRGATTALDEFYVKIHS